MTQQPLNTSNLATNGSDDVADPKPQKGGMPQQHHTSSSPSNGEESDEMADPTLWEHIKIGVKELIHAATEPLRMLKYGATSSPGSDAGGAKLMGISYASSQDPALADDFQSRFWMTYRHSYPPIKPSSFTTDVGWGCMLRSGQMLLANAFQLHYLGRDWRLSKLRRGGADWENYVKIISWFMDSNLSPYSIHRIALLGKNYDKEIGHWFGPSTISQVLKSLHESNMDTNMAMYVATDGVIILDGLKQACQRIGEDGKKKWSSVLILIPIRLGLDHLNPVYVDAIKKSLDSPYSVGIAGGRPNSSLFFVGYEGNHLLYLDPHYLRQVVDMKDSASYDVKDLETYHCETIRFVTVDSIDPTMVLGFYCQTEADLNGFLAQAKLHLSSGKTPLFTIQESAPNYNDAEIMSDSDEF